MIPQRRKRRRTNQQEIKSEPFNFIDQTPHTPQIINDLHESQIGSLDSLISSSSSSSAASPIQELGYIDDLFPFIDDIYGQEKIKFIHDFPSIDDLNDVFGINNNQHFSLFTPTMSTLSFFA